MNPDRPILSLEELEAFDPHAPRGARRRFCCPLCGAGKARDSAHRCLSVDTQSGLWTCFRCEAGGRLRDKWMEKPTERRGQTRRALQSAFHASGPLREAAPCAESSLITEAMGAPASLWSHPTHKPSEHALTPPHASLPALEPLEGSAGEAYLAGRGLPMVVCLAARVRFCPSWLGRPAAVFPLYDQRGELVSAQGRYVDGRTDPKARTLGPKKHGVFLSGGFWEQVRGGAPVVITEAPIDALSLAACGFPALALCGKSGWPDWLPVRCAFKDVALAFDADEAGDEGAQKMQPVLEALGARVRRLSPESAKDWNEMLSQRGTPELGDWLCLHLFSVSYAQ